MNHIKKYNLDFDQLHATIDDWTNESGGEPTLKEKV